MTGTLPGQPARTRVAPARRIRDVLRARILTGAYGERPLPPETELAAEFGASRNIVRDVLTLLRAEGLVDRIPGAGTFVVSAKAVQGLDRLRGLAETFDAGAGRVVNQVVLDPMTVMDFACPRWRWGPRRASSPAHWTPTGPASPRC